MAEYDVTVRKFKMEKSSTYRFPQPLIPDIHPEHEGQVPKVVDGKVQFEGSMGFAHFVWDEEDQRYYCKLSTFEMIEMAKNSYMIALLEKKGEQTKYLPLVSSVDEHGSVSFSYTQYLGGNRFAVRYLLIAANALMFITDEETVWCLPTFDRETDVGKVLMINEKGDPEWTTLPATDATTATDPE